MANKLAGLTGSVQTQLDARTVGPASATNGHLAVYDGTTGKLIKDGGALGGGAGDVVGPASATDGHLVVFDTTTGKLIKDGGAVPGGGDVSTCWPVGSVFTSVVATNPNTLLGFGTWGAIAAGRVLIGLDAADANFDTVEETGGAKTVQSSAQTFAGSALATHQHAAITAGTPAGSIGTPSGTAQKIGTSTAAAAISSHTHTFTGSALVTHQHAAITAGTPSGTNTPGAATSVVQPYLVVYFWERTA